MDVAYIANVNYEHSEASKLNPR